MDEISKSSLLLDVVEIVLWDQDEGANVTNVTVDRYDNYEDDHNRTTVDDGHHRRLQATLSSLVGAARPGTHLRNQISSIAQPPGWLTQRYVMRDGTVWLQKPYGADPGCDYFCAMKQCTDEISGIWKINYDGMGFPSLSVPAEHMYTCVWGVQSHKFVGGSTCPVDYVGPIMNPYHQSQNEFACWFYPSRNFLVPSACQDERCGRTICESSGGLWEENAVVPGLELPYTCTYSRCPAGGWEVDPSKTTTSDVLCTKTISSDCGEQCIRQECTSTGDRKAHV